MKEKPARNERRMQRAKKEALTSTKYLHPTGLRLQRMNGLSLWHEPGNEPVFKDNIMPSTRVPNMFSFSA